MEKVGLIKNNEKMGAYELEKGFASYKTLVNYFIGDLVLCNSIAEVDNSIYDNLEFDLEDEDGNFKEIYQYFVCNVGQWDKEQAKKAGLLFTYSDLLDCDVLCVDHWGTSWDYVLTDVRLFDNYEDLEKWESSNNEN